MKCFLISLMFCLLPIICAGNTTICPCVADTIIIFAAADWNYGYLGNWGAGQLGVEGYTMRGLVKYDLSAISPGIDVIGVSFCGWIDNFNNELDYIYYSYPIATNWYENTVTWNNQPLVCSITSEPIFTIQAPEFGGFWYNVAFSTQGNKIVQGWIDCPSDNFGMEFFREDDFIRPVDVDYLMWGSKEYEHPSKLIVYWEENETHDNVQSISIGKIKGIFN